MLKRIIAIFGFGFLGSAIRLGLTTLLGTHHYLTIFCINVVGSLLLALITQALPRLLPISPAILSGLSVGLIGSFTTFSTFSVDTVTLMQQAGDLLAGLYFAGSLFCGCLAALWGRQLSHKWVEGRRFQ